MPFNVQQASMLDNIIPSGIRKMFARAAGLEGVISLGIGAPDIQPPQGLIDAVISRVSKKSHGYTLNNGIPQIHDKIKNQYKIEYGLDFSNNTVIIGAGATQLMYGAIFAYNNPGDEVIVPDPGFVYYPTIPLMAGCKIKAIALDNEFQMSPDMIAEKITKNTKMLIINTPGNPTGTVLNEKSLKGIADIAIDNNIVILSDEVYEFMTFDGIEHIPMAKYAPDNTITLNSFSKTYCVPGWRLGYATGEKNLMEGLAKIHPYMVANAPSLSQHAIADFMGTPEDKVFRDEVRKIMEKRRDIVTKEFSQIPGVSVPRITGSFYAFPKIESDLYRSNNPGYEFAEDIFDNAKVVTVAASEFGATRHEHFRISFGSANADDITEAALRIKNYVESK